MTPLERITRARDIVAALAAVDPVYLPHLDRAEEELRRIEAAERIAGSKYEVVGRRAKARAA